MTEAQGHPTDQPTLKTVRLLLRPFAPADAPRLVELAGNREIADTTISLPHPYPLRVAEQWIASHPAAWSTDRAVHFAIALQPRGALVGSVSLREIDRAHFQAELGFWIGRPHWGSGYASEAVPKVLSFAFGPLGLNRVHAHHMVRNPASGRVLEKAGFQREGLLRQRVIKWGRFEDVALVAILRVDWARAAADNPDSRG